MNTAPTTITVHTYITVHDEPTFRQAAYAQALKDRLTEDEASHYLNDASLGECAVMVFDPGVSPAGCSIEESTSEETS